MKSRRARLEPFVQRHYEIDETFCADALTLLLEKLPKNKEGDPAKAALDSAKGGSENDFSAEASIS